MMKTGWRTRVATWRPTPRVILVVAFLIQIVYAFPGYMNFDVGQQLMEIRGGRVSDFHPPMMGGYWRIFEIFVTGPFPMLLLQTSLFLWGLYTVLCMRFQRIHAAWIAAAILLFPPVLTPLGMIWKDSQLSAFLMAGTALVLKPSMRAKVVGLLLFVGAAGVRFNGAAALPFLCLGMMWFVHEGKWTFKKRATSLGIAAAITLGCIGVATVTNVALTRKFAHNWYRTTAILDIVGTTCFAPPLTDEEILKILDGVELSIKQDIQKTFCERYPAGKGAVGTPPWYFYSEAFDWTPTKTDRLARKRAWKHLVFTYPGAYLQHRLTLGGDLLGWGDVRIWEPVGQDFTANPDHAKAVQHDHKHSWFQRKLGDACRWLAENTPLYRVYIYLILCTLFFGFAVWKRDLLVGMLTGSGLLYEVSLVIGANAPDFRYSHWLITCTLLGAVFIAASRWRSVRPQNVSISAS
jgi:hypothetical protein